MTSKEVSNIVPVVQIRGNQLQYATMAELLPPYCFCSVTCLGWSLALESRYSTETYGLALTPTNTQRFNPQRLEMI